MAYVVRRPRGRFEVRESIYTQDGPRARSLASFRMLTPDVLDRARRRAARPFSDEDVKESARRLGIAIETDWDATRFVEASRRMAGGLVRSPRGPRRDPGATLIELLNFTDMVAESVGRRPWEPLAFPIMVASSPEG